jgi:site-specific DNA recombinase
MIGPLAHILKNRFYIGEVAYRGEIHKGEHAPILDRQLFDAVQARLAERAVRRKMRRSRSPSLLMGLIFDDRGNPMSPSHANKKGVRYRYYVSQAILQNRKSEAGSVSRVSGPDIETIVVEALRRAIADRKFAADDQDGDRGADVSERDRTTRTTNSTVAAASPDSDRDLIARHVARIVLRPRAIEITLSDKRDDHGDASRAAAGVEQHSLDDADQRAARSDRGAPETERHRTDGEPSIRRADAQRSISIPWMPSAARRRKGVVHRPASLNLDPRDRDALLTAIAKARSWMDDLIEQRVQSFEEIAERERKVARHIRFLAPLAFLSPRIVAAIANGDVPAGVTVSGLVRSLPFNWAEQEQRFGLR